MGTRSGMTTVCHHTAVCLTTNAAANARRQCEQTGARLPGSPTPAPSRATPARLQESTDILRAKGLPPLCLTRPAHQDVAGEAIPWYQRCARGLRPIVLRVEAMWPPSLPCDSDSSWQGLNIPKKRGEKECGFAGRVAMAVATQYKRCQVAGIPD